MYFNKFLKKIVSLVYKKVKIKSKKTRWLIFISFKLKNLLIFVKINSDAYNLLCKLILLLSILINKFLLNK